MRNIVLSLAAAGAALIVASPAVAQYSPPQPAPYGYNGYNRGFGEVRGLHERLENIERQIDRLDRRDRIGDYSAARLRGEANRIEARLRFASRGGLNPYEFNDLRVRVDRLEQRVQFAIRRGYGRDRDDRFRDRDGD